MLLHLLEYDFLNLSDVICMNTNVLNLSNRETTTHLILGNYILIFSSLCSHVNYLYEYNHSWKIKETDAAEESFSLPATDPEPLYHWYSDLQIMSMYKQSQFRKFSYLLGPFAFNYTHGWISVTMYKKD